RAIIEINDAPTSYRCKVGPIVHLQRPAVSISQLHAPSVKNTDWGSDDKPGRSGAGVGLSDRIYRGICGTPDKVPFLPCPFEHAAIGTQHTLSSLGRFPECADEVAIR